MKLIRLSLLLISITISHSLSSAQTTHKISGTIYDSEFQTPLNGVNITIVGTVLGTISDNRGQFSITIRQDFPVQLSFSMMGYASQSILVDSTNSTNLSVALKSQILKMDEIVVGASRMEEKMLRSPVTIEKLDIYDFRETASVNFYDALADVKGMQMNFVNLAVKDMNVRGFTSSGSASILQIVDGMDNQFPATNTPLGNAYGVRELDIESIEIVPGPSSALYGANALNGLFILYTKSPFLYQGLTAQVKSGVTSQQTAGTFPYHEVGIRYARALNEKFAFKFNLSYLRGENWHAMDDGDRDTNPVNADVRGPDSPSYDGMNLYGDEVTATFDLDEFTGAPAGTFGRVRIARTGYTEMDLMPADVTLYNGDVTLDYRLTDKLEAIYCYKVGYTPGTPTVGGGRRGYAITGLQQQKLELKGSRFVLRACSTSQPWGETYNALTTAININSSWKSNGAWFTDYVSAYLDAVNAGQSVKESHRTARSVADRGRLLPGTDIFQATRDTIIHTASEIKNRTGFINLEGIYRFDQLDFMDLLAGGNVRRYKLDSGGDFFYDISGPVYIREFGAFAIASKTLGKRLKISGSLRYDKSENLRLLTPRIATAYSMGSQKNHNFRVSLQTGFKNPSNIDQYIYSDLGGTILLGGAKNCVESYAIDLSTPIVRRLTGPEIYQNSYTQSSVFKFLSTGNPDDLQILDIDYIQPFEIQTWEVGYKGIIADWLFLDINYYHNRYTHFIGSTNAITPLSGEVHDGSAVADIADGHYLTHTLMTNSNDIVTSDGIECGLQAGLGKGYKVGGNYSFATLNRGNATTDFVPGFNTPDNMFNLYFTYSNINDHWGLKVNYRWVDSFLWNVNNYWVGTVRSYSVFDTQVSYRLSALKSQLKLGATNLLNRDYQLGIGNGTIGGLYYISLTFDQFLY
ncbi:TonB-dependent receptor [candidate division KSB1 bacterium]|nr:TonB-dependent receptor [candidate division KSB1 bacterium]